MFNDNVTRRLLKIEDEIRAQKSSQSINYGSLKDDDPPKTDWSGTVSNDFNQAEGVCARWILTFKRTDGLKTTPLVMFAYDYKLATGYYGDQIASGTMKSAKGSDIEAIDELNFTDGFYEVGEDFIKHKIDLGGQYYYAATNGTSVTILAEAITPISGTLSIERII